jgi:hypothetical protein
MTIIIVAAIVIKISKIDSSSILFFFGAFIFIYFTIEKILGKTNKKIGLLLGSGGKLHGLPKAKFAEDMSQFRRFWSREIPAKRDFPTWAE